MSDGIRGLGVQPDTRELAGLARDSGLNIAGTLVSQGAGIALVLVLARALGDEAVGVYSQAFALRALLMLVCGLGARVSMTHFVARYRADSDAGSVRGAIRLGLASTTVLSVAAGVLLSLSAGMLARDVFDDLALAGPIRLAALSLPFFVVMTVALAATQGFKTMRAFAGVGLIFEPGSRFALTALFVALGFGVGGAMWALVIASVCAALLSLYALRTYVAEMGPAQPIYEVGVIARFSAYSWVASMATQGLLWADVVILGVFVSSAEVGIYQVASRVVLLGSMMTAALTASLGPRVADAWRRNDRGMLQEQYRALTGWTFRLSLPLFAVIVVFPDVVLGVFGGSFEEGSGVIWWLAAGALIDTLAAPSAVTLNQANRNRVNMAINVCALAMNIGMNLVLIPMFGITGAAAAWSLSLVVPGIARVVAVRALVTGILPWNAAQAKALLAACVTAVVLVGFRQAVTWPGLAELFVGSNITLVLYVVLVRLMGAAPEDRLAVAAILGAVHRHVFDGRRRLEKWRLRRRLAKLPVGDGPLRLDHLVSPFRYDIEIRREFLALVAENQDLWRASVESFLPKARESSYYAWYRSVAVRSIGIDETDLDEIERGFGRRVLKTLALFDEFSDGRCFDARYPVTVRLVEGRIGERKLMHSPRYVPVDGCHRIALLLLNGRRELASNEYRIERASAPALDNTEQLTALLNVDERTYVAFMARGFIEEECCDRATLLRRIDDSDPMLAVDVRSWMAIDDAASAVRSV